MDLWGRCNDRFCLECGKRFTFNVSLWWRPVHCSDECSKIGFDRWQKGLLKQESVEI